VRAVFLFLVLANLAFFAWANFLSEVDTQSDPRPMARQVSPEKLRVLPPSPSIKPGPAAAARPAADGASLKPVIARACIEIGGFSPVDAARATEALAPLALGARLSQRQVDENAGWWVYIGPRGGRLEAQKKTGELKALGVDDYFVVQDEGPMRYSVSLGVFKTEAAATSRLESLRAKGVKTAQVGARDALLARIYLQVKAPDDAISARFRELAQSLGGGDVRDCPAGGAGASGNYRPRPLIASTTMRVPTASSRMLSSTRT
jgi:hypothetical protein